MATPEKSTAKAPLSANTNDLRGRKKAAVLGVSPRGRKTLILSMTLCILAAAGVAAALFTFQKGPGQPAAASAEVHGQALEGDVVSFPASVFADGKARHFELADGGRTIRYFIVQSTDDVIRAAFDACDVCWPAGKGYVQDGSAMVCVNCGRRFETDRVNVVQGGCNPAPLERTVVDGQLVIRRAHILAGAGYFDFRGGTNG